MRRCNFFRRRIREYQLNQEEISVVRTLQASRIPSIFKNEYMDYLLYFEFIDFEISDMLLHGERIDEESYSKMFIDPEMYEVELDLNKLDRQAKAYYDNCMRVIEIAKKYHK